MTSIWFNFLLKIFWPRFDSICISSLALLLCSPAASATLEWHSWIEARHCQLIINTLSCVVSLRFPQLSLPVYVCVSVWGVLLCVVRRLWDDLRAERCLPAQAPCLRIKAAREKLHKEVKEVLTRRHRSFPVFVFFLPIPCFVLSTSQKSLAVHYRYKQQEHAATQTRVFCFLLFPFRYSFLCLF